MDRQPYRVPPAVQHARSNKYISNHATTAFLSDYSCRRRSGFACCRYLGEIARASLTFEHDVIDIRRASLQRRHIRLDWSRQVNSQL